MAFNFKALVESTEELDDLQTRAIEGVLSREITVLSLVEALEPYLVNKDESKRAKGTLFLSSVLLELDNDFLDIQEATVLTAFFCDRLKDHFSVIPSALKGIQAISAMDNLPSESPDQIIISLTQNITCQTLHQSSRNTFYNILQNLFNNKYEIIKVNPGDFVYSVISAMDSESDPRNLLFLFNFLPDLFQKLEFKHLTEEAFSILECYFPVDFNSSDKGGITRDDLAQGLENCFISCENFGSLVIPMVLEKLDSALKVAHIDSLKLLINGYENFPVEALNPHVAELWNAFKSVILPSTDTEVSDLAIRALVGLIQKYASSPLSSTQFKTLDQLLGDILLGTTRFLNDPTLNLFLPATKLLSAVSQASAVSSICVIKNVVPQFLVLLNHKSNHDVIVTSLSVILNSSIKYNLWDDGENEEVKSTLLLIPNILIDKLNDPTSCHGCFSCLNAIITVLTSEMRLQIIDAILKINTQSSFADRDSCEEFIKAIAKKYPEEVKENLLSKLNMTGSQNEIKHKVNLLCCCTNAPPLLEYSIDEIMKYLNNKEISHVVIKCLRSYCEKTDNEIVLHCFGAECKLVQKLMGFFKNGDSYEIDVLMDYSKTIEAIVRCMLENEQQDLISECMETYSETFLSSNYIVLLKGLLIAIRQSVKINNCQRLVIKLSDKYLMDENDFIKLSSSILLASLINKHPVGGDLNETLEIVSKRLDDNLLTNNIATKTAAVELLTSITQSLILRGHHLSNQWLDKLLELLNDGQLQMAAAKGFKCILTPSDDISERNHCTIKLLYKQRIFSKMNKLISLLNEITEPKRPAVFLAISFILQSVPKSIIISELKELMKVIVMCLESQDQSVNAAILEVISNILQSNEEAFEEHIQTLVPKCLKGVKSTHMIVRMWSLDCLFYYGKYPEIKILPYKPMVLEGVQFCLDDKKRLVRQKAVRVITRWSLLGSTMDKIL